MTFFCIIKALISKILFEIVLLFSETKQRLTVTKSYKFFCMFQICRILLVYWDYFYQCKEFKLFYYPVPKKLKILMFFFLDNQERRRKKRRKRKRNE